eukprot:TRINITY_DN28054_c0_g1_i1.p1 TRINITY_DN28054_c0_g1~~TRINITY_DN28054_c0_g1_i1.p1  ORF type:complete len:138 (-),score=5.35 TRINITY_DN28054_c0_g1_i1:99-512(-)
MVLRSAGFPVGRLLFWNFLVSLTCMAGVGLVHVLGETAMAVLIVQRYMTAFTAGSFLTLSLNMIFPQVLTSISKHHSSSQARALAKLLCCALSVLAIYILVRIGDLEDHSHHDHGHDHSHGHGHAHGHSHGHGHGDL